MKIIVARTVAVIDYIKDYLILDETRTTKEQYISQLTRMIVEEPENVFIITGFDEGDPPELAGFLVAYADPNNEFCYISQAWNKHARTQTERSLLDLSILRLIMWARSRNKTRLIMETKREPSAFMRRWGFHVKLTVMEKEIDAKFEEELTEKLTHEMLKGDQNERRSTDGKHVDRESEANSSATGGSDQAEPGEGSDTVQRDTGAESDAAVAEQSKPVKSVQSEPNVGGDVSGEQAPEWETIVRSQPGDDDELVREGSKDANGAELRP